MAATERPASPTTPETSTLTQPTASETGRPEPRATGWRRGLGEFVLSDRVQTFVLVVIVLNAVTLGLETSPAVMARVGGLLHVLDVVALAIFVVEIVLKLVALGGRFFRDGWNVFDFLVVAVSLVPAAGPFSVLRALRVLRVLRLINRMPALRRIASAIVGAIPGIGAIAALMGIVFYVGAVMATMLFGDAFPEWFGSVPASLYSLFQVMTLESWSMGIVRPVMEVFPQAWMFFVPFILASAFVMLNLFVAVMVDTMSAIDSTEKGTIAAPAPVPETVPRREHAVFGADAELAAMRAELAEIKALLVARAAESSDAVER